MFHHAPVPPRPGRHHHRDIDRGQRDAPFGFRGMFGPGHGGRRVIRRGEIRPLILSTLARRPMHGYEIIQELEAQSGGRWRPSAGSVYPTLQQLADEGLVTSEEVDGRRTYTLTEEGHTAAAAAAAAPGRRHWEDTPSDGGDLRGFVEAVMQVQRVGSPRARDEARRILADARRELYRLLADDEVAPAGEPSGDDVPFDRS